MHRCKMSASVDDDDVIELAQYDEPEMVDADLQSEPEAELPREEKSANNDKEAEMNVLLGGLEQMMETSVPPRRHQPNQLLDVDGGDQSTMIGADQSGLASLCRLWSCEICRLKSCSSVSAYYSSTSKPEDNRSTLGRLLRLVTTFCDKHQQQNMVREIHFRLHFPTWMRKNHWRSNSVLCTVSVGNTAVQASGSLRFWRV